MSGFWVGKGVGAELPGTVSVTRETLGSAPTFLSEMPLRGVVSLILPMTTPFSSSSAMVEESEPSVPVETHFGHFQVLAPGRVSDSAGAETLEEKILPSLDMRALAHCRCALFPHLTQARNSSQNLLGSSYSSSPQKIQRAVALDGSIEPSGHDNTGVLRGQVRLKLWHRRTLFDQLQIRSGERSIVFGSPALVACNQEGPPGLALLGEIVVDRVLSSPVFDHSVAVQ